MTDLSMEDVASSLSKILGCQATSRPHQHNTKIDNADSGPTCFSSARAMQINCRWPVCTDVR